MILFSLPLTAFAEAETPSPAAASASPTTDPPADPAAGGGQLRIDSKNIYPGMDKTYTDGYIPAVKDGKVTLVLPLIGETKAGQVDLTADLGATANSPFVFGNYSQTAKGGAPYVFTLIIPLASGRINGSYPVTLNASYMDGAGALTTQSFILYVTITDGKTPADPNAVTAPTKETVDKPELFIGSCVIKPNTVSANEEFSVDITVENIGTLRARSVRLTYGGAAGGEAGAASLGGIIPVETNNSIHLDNIASGKSETAAFSLKTTGDVLAGNQSFSVTLDYLDAYGNVYTSVRQFLVTVTQPTELTYDNISAFVPKSIIAGESFSLPANIYNTGKSTLKNVMITATGAGLFPTASVYLGNIAPGATGNGELSIFAGMLSMTQGFTENYGKTNGTYLITYTDSAGEEQKIEIAFATEIIKPELDASTKPADATQQPAFQWWVTILVGFAIIAIVVSVIVVTKVMRTSKIK